MTFGLWTTENKVANIGIRYDVGRNLLKSNILGLYTSGKGCPRFYASPNKVLKLRRDFDSITFRMIATATGEKSFPLRYLPSSGG